MRLVKKFVGGLKKHAVESTAAVLVLTPTYATLEHLVSNMSRQESQSARLTGAILMYAGLGKIISYGREKYLASVHVDKESPPSLQARHDRIYGALFNLVISPPYYLAMGVDDPAKIGMGTLSSVIFGYLAQGQILGSSIDVCKDFAGLEPSPKTPGFLKSLHGPKKALAPALAGAASYALTEIVWRLPSAYET